MIRANGSANLFLINPNGIIFGENASLNIGGSFLASIADSILFEEGEFSTTDLDTPLLLTINAPVGLGLPDNPAEIVNRSTVQDSEANSVGLEVIGGNNLSLVGGKIEFEGGKATTSQGIFGLEERNSTPPNQTNDIDASSEFGLSGEVEINILQVDPSQDSLNIPSAPVETEVAQICEPSDFGNQSEFIVTGRGGIPESPETSFNGDFGLEDWRVGEEDSLFSASSSNESLLRAEDENSEPIVEADSWIVNDQGKVVLVAHNTPNTSSELAQQSSNCQAK